MPRGAGPARDTWAPNGDRFGPRTNPTAPNPASRGRVTFSSGVGPFTRTATVDTESGRRDLTATSARRPSWRLRSPESCRRRLAECHAPTGRSHAGGVAPARILGGPGHTRVTPASG